MSESSSASRNLVPISGPSPDSLEQTEEPDCPTVAAPLEPSIEQIRALKGTLNYLAALITYYGELIEQDTPAGARLAGREGVSLQ